MKATRTPSQKHCLLRNEARRQRGPVSRTCLVLALLAFGSIVACADPLPPPDLGESETPLSAADSAESRITPQACTCYPKCYNPCLDFCVHFPQVGMPISLCIPECRAECLDECGCL
jgi:hypothetical protein